jgi:hypothetical protein
VHCLQCSISGWCLSEVSRTPELLRVLGSGGRRRESSQSHQLLRLTVKAGALLKIAEKLGASRLIGSRNLRTRKRRTRRREGKALVPILVVKVSRCAQGQTREYASFAGCQGPRCPDRQREIRGEMRELRKGGKKEKKRGGSASRRANVEQHGARLPQEDGVTFVFLCSASPCSRVCVFPPPCC